MNLLDRAINMARHQASSARNNRWKHGAVILKKNKILSVGKNKKNCFYFDLSRKIQLYAEASACSKASDKDLIDSTVVSIRVSSNGEIKCSRPCEKCRRLLKRKGIANVVFFDRNGSMLKEKI